MLDAKIIEMFDRVAYSRELRGESHHRSGRSHGESGRFEVGLRSDLFSMTDLWLVITCRIYNGGRVYGGITKRSAITKKGPRIKVRVRV